ncbi:MULTISPECIES: UDP-4-amino-4,6-dideoxy-N-acetyl-beta-L-altrosamine N-acetyltransferase [Clostridia]|uniref:UDP-4-amino-4, 6-dideoxy-N-acetyl-beta-L-altrosamine N-acetyltransferase n=1 Tax=Clostridia TaxID=186801 RepID=UPI000EA054B5|nr:MULTISPECIES: UDP-4-amino-4,6-dideoxy-N-acetyl-beta-L-altrosamine N-acetyltransferase [Clostridia]NBJ68078.1 UDP-4-amino-4,6-dideoxy-N-acetyl-beta-L-altrosamine N-acetyltransferase [Roseburia sp. 1XD42-34]RKI82519.1 UDP-4-amino-4,6-dideoxy-N-acetyl-beta-L-altrosamine N-acetyltransferase [Clostridium sp. 1xD42-85]
MTNIHHFQLRPLCQGDLQTVLKWRNSDRVKAFMYTDHTITWEEHCRWYKDIANDPYRKVFILDYKKDRLGLVQFSNIDKGNSRCYWGFYIGEAQAPKGAGTIMAILALDKIFNNVGMRKVCSEIIHTNSVSIRYHEKLGFVPEGRLLNHIRKDDRYFDVIVMALFLDKWKQVRVSLMKKEEKSERNCNRK